MSETAGKLSCLAGCKQEITLNMQTLCCQVCKGISHQECILPPGTPLLTRSEKRHWVCPDCRSKTKRKADNTNTPVKGSKGSLSESTVIVNDLNKDAIDIEKSNHDLGERDHDLKKEFHDFKEEIKQMIISLFSTQEKELREINISQKQIQNTNQNIERSIAFLTAQNEELKKRITTLEGQAVEDRKCMAILEDRIEDLQRGSRKSNIEIKNVPKQKNETKNELTEMILCLSNNIGSTINKSDIKDIFRARGKKDTTQNSTIIIELSSTLLKTDLLKKCKEFNVKQKTKLCAKHLGLRTNEDTPIYISEQLTAKGSRLYYLARDLSKTKEYKYCWTAYGKVFVRKDDNSPTTSIYSEAQVQQLSQI